MKGTRPLDNDEIRLVSACFTGTFEVRNRGLFMLGVSTGGRISELLSLRVGDVFQNGKPVTDLLFDKSIVKGKETSRAVPVNRDGRAAIDELIDWHREKYGNTASTRPLFPSRNGQGLQPMSRRTAHNVLKDAFMDAGLNGHIATHSMRKSFPYLVEPDVWDYCVNTLGAKTVLDIGAGEGHAAAYFSNKGCHVVAVDNDENAINSAVYPIVQHDFTTGAFVGGQFDMVYMAEFVEHLPEASLSHLGKTLLRTNLVLMTYAIPGNDGVGHVNLQEETYWVQWMAHQGFDLDQETTYAVRAKAKHVHFKDRELVFRRQ